ncbi:6037_t:CDS:2, partial [Dentiscutata heterogama]
PYYPLRMCGWCGAIGHSSKNCNIRKSGRLRVDNNHKRALIQGLNKFKNIIVLPNVWFDIEYRPYYQPYRPRQIPYRPRRRRIPNYIAACGCCGNENHARNDPNAPCRNQNCINPRLVRSLREQRLYYIENGIQMPNNIEDIRAGRQQFRDTIRNLFNTQNNALNQLNNNIRNLNTNQNDQLNLLNQIRNLINQQNNNFNNLNTRQNAQNIDIVRRIENLRQRYVDGYQELTTDIRNTRNDYENIIQTVQNQNQQQIIRNNEDLRQIYQNIDQHYNDIIRRFGEMNQGTGLMRQEDLQFRTNLYNTINRQFDERQQGFINSIINTITNNRRNFRINRRREIQFRPRYRIRINSPRIREITNTPGSQIQELPNNQLIFTEFPELTDIQPNEEPYGIPGSSTEQNQQDMQGLIKHMSSTGQEIGEARVEPQSSSDSDDSGETIRYQKGLSRSSSKYSIIENIEYEHNPNPQRELNNQQEQQIQVRVLTPNREHQEIQEIDLLIYLLE